MAERYVRERLKHMMEAVAAIERLTVGKTRDDYTADPDLAASVERYLERLSEASRHVPDALKEKHGSVDWRGVEDIGNVLRHAYNQIVDHRIWQIVASDLAPLKATILAINGEVSQQDSDGG